MSESSSGAERANRTMLLSEAYAILALEKEVSMNRVRRRYLQICEQQSKATICSCSEALGDGVERVAFRKDMAAVHTAFQLIYLHKTTAVDKYKSNGLCHQDTSAESCRTCHPPDLFPNMVHQRMADNSSSFGTDDVFDHRDLNCQYDDKLTARQLGSIGDDNDDQHRSERTACHSPSTEMTARCRPQFSMHQNASSEGGRHQRADSDTHHTTAAASTDQLVAQDDMVPQLVSTESDKKGKRNRKKKKRKRRKSSSTADNQSEQTADSSYDHSPIGRHQHVELKDYRLCSSSSESDASDGFDLNSAFARAKVGVAAPTRMSAAAIAAVMAAGSPVCESSTAAASINIVDGVAVIDGGAVCRDDPAGANYRRAQQMALQGNSLAANGRFAEAVRLFTSAIHLDPVDHRFYGNRGYCYEQLHQYDRALLDADRAIELDDTWPKGHFRRGCALLGQMRYDEAEVSFNWVLQLDPGVQECHQQLSNIAVYRLMQLGFSESVSRAAVQQHNTFICAFNALVSARAFDKGAYSGEIDAVIDDDDDGGGVVGCPIIAASPSLPDNKFDPSNVDGLLSLWVGNILPTVTSKEIEDLFSQYGDVMRVRLLPEKHCAFVNFRTSDCASSCMRRLQGVLLHGSSLKIKFPDHPIDRTLPNQVPGRAGVENGVISRAPAGPPECHYWRKSHCVYGEQCRFLHVPANKLADALIKQ